MPNNDFADTRTGWEAVARVPSFLDPGDIIHVQTRGPIFRLLRWFSRADDEGKTFASHTAMVLSADQGVRIIEALSSVVARPLEAYRNSDARLVITRKPGGLTPVQQRQVAAKAAEYRGRRFGYLKIMAHALDRLFNNAYVFRWLARMDDYPICSWLVAYVYDRCLGLRFGVKPNAAQPDDIMDFCLHQKWEVIWTDSPETLNWVRQVGRLADSESVTAPAGQSKPGPAPRALSCR